MDRNLRDGLRLKPATTLSVLCVVLLMGLSSMTAFAAPEDESTNITIEYRYAEGETVEVPEIINQLGREYRLVEKRDPVLESTLPITRTYTYKIDGVLSPEQLAEVSAIPGLTLTPVMVETEREVDKTEIVPGLQVNDVELLPEYKQFDVTSAVAPGGTAKVMLKRAGVDFRITNVSDGLPDEYEATVVYRGVESYGDLGYYSATMNYETTRVVGEQDQYIIVAIYEPTAVPEAVTTVTEPAEPEAAAEPEFATDDEARLAAQTGNLFTDLANGNVPLGNFAGQGSWSLLSLILSIACAISTVCAVVKRRRDGGMEVYEEDGKRYREGTLKLFAIAAGILTIALWLILDDIGQPVTLINRWTPIISGFFVVHVVLLVGRKVMSRKGTRKAQDQFAV